MIHLLQTALNPSDSGSYMPVLLQVLIALGLVGLLMFVTHMLGPKRRTSDKLQNFASGIETHGDARQPMAIKYFLTAILFVLFDVEVIFLPLRGEFHRAWLERFLGCFNVCGILPLRIHLHRETGSAEMGGLK